MTNFEVYKKTLSFSLLKFAVDLFTMVVVAGCMAAGFFIMNTTTDKALIGLAIGLIIGIIFGIIAIYANEGGATNVNDVMVNVRDVGPLVSGFVFSATDDDYISDLVDICVNGDGNFTNVIEGGEAAFSNLNSWENRKKIITV